MLEKYLSKNNLHHAYLLKDTGESIIKELKDFLKVELEFSTEGNPDFWCGKFDTFGIGDGKEIMRLQSRKATTGDIKIFVIVANFFTTEAQNSLLKIFEEPTSGTHFFVITQNTKTLLPTLLSRLFLPSIDTYSDKSSFEYINIKEFLKINKAKRLVLIRNIIDTKDKSMAISFLDELEDVMYKRFQDSTAKVDLGLVLEEIIKSKKYLNGRSPGMKIILEHISMVIPEYIDSK